MKIKKILLCVTIGLVAIGVITMGDSLAQQGPPPDIKVYLALDLKDNRVPNQPLYFRDSSGTDRIKIVLTLLNRGDDTIYTSKGFSTRPFHLYLTITDPDGNAIIAKKLQVLLKEDALPPETIDVNGEPIQVDPVETLLGGAQRWTLSITIPDAHAFYTLTKGGRYSVKAIIPMRTYHSIDYPGSIPYSKLDDPPSSPKWSGNLQSNTEYFTLLVDDDNDSYYYPEGWPSGAPPDCNDKDTNEKPGQTWYKDADNDGYSDGTTDTTSCTRPQGYKVASELAAMTVDCNDGNSNVNPGMTEVVCNEIDDDCNPATPDVPPPTPASPANGATNVSLTPTFTWNTGGCATSYGLQIATTQSFSPPSTVVIDQSVTGTSFTVSTSTPLSNNTTYYWHVNAKKSGETSAWSTAWSFSTISLGPLYRITISPDTATIIVRGSQAYTATGYDQDNNSWDVTSTTTLSISPDGSCNNTTHTCTATNVGVHTVTGNNAGKIDTATLDVIYHYTGFLSPIQNSPTVNTSVAGTTTPLKWRITDAMGVGISDRGSFVSFTSSVANCQTWTTSNPNTETSGVKYNDDGYWQYNWKTPKTPGTCYIITIGLLDGTEHQARFKLVK